MLHAQHAKDVVRGVEMSLRQESLFNWFGEEANDRGASLAAANGGDDEAALEVQTQLINTGGWCQSDFGPLQLTKAPRPPNANAGGFWY